MKPYDYPLSDSCAVHEDPIIASERLLELEIENENLRRQLDASQRQYQSQSPTRSAKSQPQLQQALGLMSDSSAYNGTGLYDKLSELSLKDNKETRTPGKKVRKFTARRWDFMDENEMNAYENM